MDFNIIKTKFDSFGTVDFLGFNDLDTTRVILVINGFNNTIENITSINSVINENIIINYPYIEDFTINGNILKAVFKNVE